jgi:hypothetical protein
VAALQISDSDRSRRDKLVGMLGSSFDGERLNALGLLQRMADNYKVPIHEFLLATGSSGAGSNSEQATRKAQNPDPAEPGPKLPSNWRALFVEAQQLNGSRFFLTVSESNFVADLIARETRFPLPKQAAVIARILEKAAVFSSRTTGAAAEDWEDVP